MPIESASNRKVGRWDKRRRGLVCARAHVGSTFPLSHCPISNNRKENQLVKVGQMVGQTWDEVGQTENPNVVVTGSGAPRDRGDVRHRGERAQRAVRPAHAADQGPCRRRRRPWPDTDGVNVGLGALPAGGMRWRARWAASRVCATSCGCISPRNEGNSAGKRRGTTPTGRPRLSLSRG
jgi:hypothetical protein